MRPTLVALLAFVAACGGGSDQPPGADADPFAPDADPFAPDADPAAPDAGMPGGPDATPPPPALPVCQQSCATAADCVIAGSTLYDVDNWSCDASRCRYDGCNSTTECTTTFMSPDYECVTIAPSIPACQRTCGAAADCATAGSTLFDADNWSCTGGHCSWQGCNSSTECTSTYMNPDYVCEAIPGLPFDSCVETCGAPADCATAGSTIADADNWACDAARCRYLGCNSTAECTTAYMDPDYVCD